MIPAWLLWLLAGLAIGLLEWPFQLISELGFLLQRQLWSLSGLPAGAAAAANAWPLWIGPLLVLVGSLALLSLAWGPLARGRGGGVAPLLALDRYGVGADGAHQQLWLHKPSLATQLQRLLLMLITHIGGLSVGIESPAAALGASALLALRRR
ncbi:MAG: chloride channel protein, partial [Cyanobacteria bacterium M_surface_9_m1_291]|nr:chloride channel protein [Cyanobacteria bacterium M_surface_9_m1_291]